MSKNIEKIKGEDALSEIIDITLDDVKLNGLVSNDVSDMYQKASGLIPLKPIDTYESSIVELKANLKLIFRRLFSVPLTILGSNKRASSISIIKMMEQMFNHYRERLKGSEKYGIPSRLSSLTDLPDAPALLADRKICGAIGAPDGMSLAQLLCSTSAASSVTELVDDNRGWVMNKALSNVFPKLADVELGCDLITSNIAVNLPSIKSIILHATEIKYNPSYYAAMIDNLKALEQLHFPELKTADFGSLGYLYSLCPNVLSITFPELKTISVCNNSCLVSATLKEFIAPKLDTINRYNIAIFLDNCTKLEKVVVHHANIDRQYQGQGDLNKCPNLIHLEFADGMNKKIYIPYWIPTNALSERLPEFLSNFKTYIAERLTDKGTGLTLTLSQEVRNAIHAAEDEYGIENIIITQKGWTISPAPN